MSATPAGETVPTGVWKWVMVGAIMVGAFVFSLNARGSVLENPVIIQALALDRYKIQWITGAEGVAGLTALLASVYLIKFVGARRTFLLGTVCLTFGSIGQALARTPWELLVAGTVRSCAGFYSIPAITVLLRTLPRHTGFAYCTFLALVFGGQVTVEPIGALLTFAPAWWVLFLVLGASGACLVLVGLFLFPDDRPGRGPEHPFDFAGAGLFVVFFALVLFLLYRGNYLGWRVSTPIVTGAVAALAALALFIWRQLVAAEPFLDLRGFTFRTVALAMVASGFWCAAMYGVAIQLPQCLLVLGYEHWKTGWVILPMGVIVVTVMFLGGFVRNRAGLVWLFRLGLTGMSVMTFWLARVDVYTPWQWVMGVTSLWALFAGMCMSPVSQLTFEGQSAQAAGATGGMKFFMRSFPGTVGILLAGVLIDRGTSWGLEFVRDAVVQGQGPVQSDVPAVRDHLVRHGSTPSEAAVQARAVLGQWVNLHAQVIGYRTGLRCCAFLALAGLAVTCFIRHQKEESVFDDPGHTSHPVTPVGTPVARSPGGAER
jgi:DHA2 family multidrug resistance protein